MPRDIKGNERRRAVGIVNKLQQVNNKQLKITRESSVDYEAPAFLSSSWKDNEKQHVQGRSYVSGYIGSYSGSISGSGYVDTTYTLESKTLNVKYKRRV